MDYQVNYSATELPSIWIKPNVGLKLPLPEKSPPYVQVRKAEAFRLKTIRTGSCPARKPAVPMSPFTHAAPCGAALSVGFCFLYSAFRSAYCSLKRSLSCMGAYLYFSQSSRISWSMARERMLTLAMWSASSSSPQQVQWKVFPFQFALYRFPHTGQTWLV